MLLGLGEVLDLCKKVLICCDHVEVGAPGKSHGRVLNHAGELYEFTSGNHKTDLSLAPSLLFGYGGCFGCVWIVWRGVGEELLLAISRN